MKISSPLAQESSGFDLTTVGFLAYALGKMTGGMIVDKELDIGNCDITLMLLQAIYLDGGDKRVVAGASPGLNGGTFVVFDDGSIDLIRVTTDGGSLVAEYNPSTPDEQRDCEAYVNANTMLGILAYNDLESRGWMDGEEYTSRSVCDIASAMRNNCSGTVYTTVKTAGKVTAGYISVIDGAKHGMLIVDAVRLVKSTPMSASEVEKECKLFTDDIGAQQIFNQPIGQA